MSTRLNRVLHQEKSAYKSAKKRLKSLKKAAKKSDLSSDDVFEEFLGLRERLSEAINLAATKEWGDASNRADVIIDGDAIIEDVPVRFLVILEKHLKRMNKVLWKMPDLAQNPKLDEMSARIERLRNEVRAARQEANLKRVEERNVARPVLDYIFEGATSGNEESANLNG